MHLVLKKCFISLVIMTTEREKSLQNVAAVNNVSMFPKHTFSKICSVAVVMVADIQSVCASR